MARDDSAWALGGLALLVGAGVYAARKEARMILLLAKVMPKLPSARAAQYVGALRRAMEEAEITTPRRVAAFLAQLAHESGEFRYWEELASGEAYEGRVDLGNTQFGDGARFKGRGPIQLTGRRNYRAAGLALGLPLEERPELAAETDVGFRVAAWYWRTRGLNELADTGDFVGLTRRINGGTNGLAQRERYYTAALAAQGVTS